MTSVLDRNPTLAAIVHTRQTIDAAGRPFQVHSEVSEHFAEALYRTLLRHRPLVAVEVGMATGVSTLAMLTAMEEAATGSLISIDPFQGSDWQGTGVAAVARAGLAGRHRLIEKPNFLALPELLAADTRIDFAYIDGMHTFEHVLLDFFYLDRMLRPGGIVAFNDCPWPAVHKFLVYLTAHRKYEEIQVGLHASPTWESRRAKVRRALGLSGLTKEQSAMRPIGEDRYFRKREHWEPPPTFFQEF